MNIEKLEEIALQLRCGEVPNLDKAADDIDDAIGEIERLLDGYKRIRDSSDSEMMDGDMARDVADEILKTPNA